MKTEIKQIIEQIRRGEVPEGYKKTKVGIVPKRWYETRLDKYLTVNKEKNIELKYSKEDVFSISGELGIVNQIELLGKSYAGVSVAPYGVVYPNDIVYTKSPLKTSPYGIIKANKTGKCGIVSTLYAVFHCNKNADSEFVQFYFESNHNLNNYLYPIVNIGAKHDMKISDENSLKGWVVFPPLAEQEKIAEILSTQDKLMELQQKKIAELQKLKKIHLNKMFPKKGDNVPEWRFNGFTDTWEQRKVSDLGNIVTGSTPATKDKSNYNGDFLFVSPADIQGNRYVTNTITTLTEKGFNKGRILKEKSTLFVSIGSTIGKVAQTLEKSTTNQQINAIEPSCEFDEDFVFTLMEKISGQIKALAATQAVPIVNKTSFGEVEINVPLDISEQEKIGQYFDNLDRLITLHQRKLEEMKKQKKSLMQLLLTGIVRCKQ